VNRKDTMQASHRTLIATSLAAALCTAAPAWAVEWHGLLEGRASAVDASRSWLDQGLGKLRDSKSNLRISQAMLGVEGDLADSISAAMVINAATDRPHLLDVNEAWVGWNPVPSGAWKTRVKAGAFFPVTSVELDYGSIGWTPTRTLSSSAINSWIGEELRTKGIELNMQRIGRLEGSPHDFGFTAAVYSANDETGTLMAWRGWTISDRITGLTEPLMLADLPVYQPTGKLVKQRRTIHPFREIDGKLGYYATVNYGYAGWFEAALMHYDNMADPLIVKDGQYAWTTRFDHLSLKLKPYGKWEVLAQAMKGYTTMGTHGVTVDFRSWYVLASHPLGQGRMTARLDYFNAGENDRIPSDPNTENGRSLAIAYSQPVQPGLSWVTELLSVRSERASRVQIGDAPRQLERSLATALRWEF
jgi:hypothetical protein